MQRTSTDINGSQLNELRDRFRDVWDFGRNVLVGWRPVDDGVDVLYAPIYALPDIAARHDSLLRRDRYLPATDNLDELVAAGCKCQRVGLPFQLSATLKTIGAVDDTVAIEIA